MADRTSSVAITGRTRVLMVGGLASSLHNFRGTLIVDMIARGHDVHVAAPGLCRDAATRAWLEAVGATCHDIELSRVGLSPVADARSLLVLTRLMRQLRPGLFIGYTVKPVIWGLIAAGWARVPRRVGLITGLGFAFTQAGSVKRHLVQALVRWLYRRALQRATLVFFQNPDDAADFRALGITVPGQAIEVVNGSGVDLTHFAQTPMPPMPMRFLFIGRLIIDKGIREFAEAAKMVSARHPEVGFELVGWLDTNPTALREAEVNAWVRDGRLCWCGALDDVRSAIAGNHVLVLPSYREGTPRTVLEAMSMGRAVITTDVPGCRETVIEGENGTLVPVRDIEALVQAIERFIAAPDEVARMGQASRRIAESKYDIHLVNAAMIRAMGL